MRQHKYRYWNGNTKEMHYKDVWDNFPLAGENEYFLEWTGLKDKNGKEIYEGDIFQDEEDQACDFVEWNDAFGGWGTNEWFLPKELVNQADSLEIIGNIYENKELLHDQ